MSGLKDYNLECPGETIRISWDQTVKKFFNHMANNSPPLSEKKIDDILLMMFEKSHPNAATNHFPETQSTQEWIDIHLSSWKICWKLKLCIWCVCLLEHEKQSKVINLFFLSQCFI